MPKVLYRQYSVIQISCSCSFRRKSILVSPTGKSHVPVHLGGNLSQSAPQGKLMFLFIQEEIYPSQQHREISCPVHLRGDLSQSAPQENPVFLFIQEEIYPSQPRREISCSFAFRRKSVFAIPTGNSHVGTLMLLSMQEEIYTREPHVGNLVLLSIQEENFTREPHVTVHLGRKSVLESPMWEISCYCSFRGKSVLESPMW